MVAVTEVDVTEVTGEEDVEISVVVDGSETGGLAIWHEEAKTAIAAAIKLSRCGDSEIMAPGSRGMTP